jgi:hypothetical protein
VGGGLLRRGARGGDDDERKLRAAGGSKKTQTGEGKAGSPTSTRPALTVHNLLMVRKLTS